MEPNDLEQSEKVPNLDEEDQQQPQQSSSSPPPAGASSPPPAGTSSPPPAPTEVPPEDLRGLGPEDETVQVEPLEQITADHSQVKKAVEQAIEEARTATVNIPADVYAELMYKAIQTTEQEQREKNPHGPL